MTWVSGIKARWDFLLGASAATLYDVSGNGNDGTNVNAPTYGALGLTYDGSTQYSHVPGVGVPTNGLTLGVLVQPGALSSAAWNSICGQNYYNNSQGYELMVAGAGDQIGLWVAHDANPTMGDAKYISGRVTGDPIHIVLAYDSAAASYTVYVVYNAGPVPIVTLTETLLDSGLDLYFGARPGNTGTGAADYWTGGIDYAWCYESLLTVDQIMQNHFQVRSEIASRPLLLRTEPLIASATPAASPLTVPGDDGVNGAVADAQAMHPSIIDFGAGNTWKSYRYWFAFTPYTFGSNPTENPNVDADQDGQTAWAQPATNPVVAEPPSPAYNSDPCIRYDAANDRLVLIYGRSDDAAANYNDNYYKTTTDGVTWSAETLHHSFGYRDGLAPCLTQLKDGTWRYYWVDASASTHVIKYVDSTGDILGPYDFANPNTCTINDASLNPWHGDVYYDSAADEYYGFFTNDGSFWFMTSADGIDWFITSGAQLAPSTSGWDDGQIYKTAALKMSDNTGWNHYYSAIGDGPQGAGSWNTGLAAINLGVTTWTAPVSSSSATLTASLALAAAVTTTAQGALAGAAALSGAVASLMTTGRTATVALTGAASSTTSSSVSATVTLSAAMTALRSLLIAASLALNATAQRAASRTINTSAALAGSVRASITAAITSAVTLTTNLSGTTALTQTFNAALALSSSIRGSASKTLAGALTLTTALARAPSAVLTASLSLAGTIKSRAARALQAALSLAGNVAGLFSAHSFQPETITDTINFITTITDTFDV